MDIEVISKLAVIFGVFGMSVGAIIMSVVAYRISLVFILVGLVLFGVQNGIFYTLLLSLLFFVIIPLTAYLVYTLLALSIWRSIRKQFPLEPKSPPASLSWKESLFLFWGNF